MIQGSKYSCGEIPGICLKVEGESQAPCIGGVFPVPMGIRRCGVGDLKVDV